MTLDIQNPPEKLLTVKNLRVHFDTRRGTVQAVRGVSFEVEEGEALAIVGESGCGKSVTAQTLLRLNPSPPARIEEGEIILGGVDVVHADKKALQRVRGELAGMIFQDPMTSLNPTMTIGKQIAEALILHKKLDRKEARSQAVKILSEVRIANAEQRASQYPCEFSGGMRQRAMIGLAIACEPKLIIADEPTTALDVTIQAQIIDLLRSIQRIAKTAIILITHDLGVAASIAQRVAVMYAGKIVEVGPASAIFHEAQHPYTWGLMASVPQPGQDKSGKLSAINGTPPSLSHPPEGCAFADRCVHCMRICQIKEPPCYDLGGGHSCSCWLLHEKAQEKSTGRGDVHV